LGQSLRTHTTLCSDPVGSPATTHGIHGDFCFVLHSLFYEQQPSDDGFIHQNTAPVYP